MVLINCNEGVPLKVARAGSSDARAEWFRAFARDMVAHADDHHALADRLLADA